MSEERIVAAFQRADLNHDGLISQKELSRIMGALASKSRTTINEDEVAAVFHVIDTDNDGKVSYAEFAQWVTSDRTGKKVLELPAGKDSKALSPFIEDARQKAADFKAKQRAQEKAELDRKHRED